MSAKFDNCPICGRGVGLHLVGDNKTLYAAVCGLGHDLNDICEQNAFKYGSKDPFQAARIWNKMVRQYMKNHPIRYIGEEATFTCKNTIFNEDLFNKLCVPKEENRQ